MCSSKNLETLTHSVIEDHFGSPQIGWFCGGAFLSFIVCGFCTAQKIDIRSKNCRGAFLLPTKEIYVEHLKSDRTCHDPSRLFILVMFMCRVSCFSCSGLVSSVTSCFILNFLSVIPTCLISLPHLDCLHV